VLGLIVNPVFAQRKSLLCCFLVVNSPAHGISAVRLKDSTARRIIPKAKEFKEDDILRQGILGVSVMRNSHGGLRSC